MLSQRPTPAKMSQEAAQKLPRYALILLLVIFALNGFWASGFWTLRDATTFGVTQSMLSGAASQWLIPSITGQPIYEVGPLSGWVSAILLTTLGHFFDPITLYRVTSLLWFAISTVAIWFGTWFLARRSEAQPLAFAFGGQANTQDYSRTIADCAVLFFVGVFGIASRQYEPTADTALLSIAAINFYGLAKGLRRPYLGTVIAGLSAGSALLASTLFSSFWLFVGSALTILLTRAYGHRRYKYLPLLVFATVLPGALWLGLVTLLGASTHPHFVAQWWHYQLSHFVLGHQETIVWFAQNFLWFLCPIWPFVLWGLYIWRRHLNRSHILVPLILSSTCLVAVFFTSYQIADNVFIAFIPSLCVFAAFSLVTVPSRHENLLDWFATAVFSLGLIFLWAYWFAWISHFAPKMARSIEMLAPNASATLDQGFAFSLITSLVWFLFVGWRLSHRPAFAWRGPFLSAAGMTAFGAAFFGLFHSAIDDNRNYDRVAITLSQQAHQILLQHPSNCISIQGLPSGIRSMLTFYGQFDVKSPADDAACRFVIVRTRQSAEPTHALTPAIQRPHTDENFFILQR